MTGSTNSVARLTVGLVIVAAAVLGLSSCDGEADHWVVIHDRVDVVATEGGDWTSCAPPPPGEKVAFLPGCLDVKKGQTIGFVNYSDTDVTVTHFQTLDAPNPFTLAKGEEKVFTVAAEGERVQLDIFSTESHGGPNMIVRP
jgi:plastocyanin